MLKYIQSFHMSMHEFTFKALHRLAPLYLNDLLLPYTPSRMLCSQGNLLQPFNMSMPECFR